MEMFITSINKHQIDIIILNETNIKWTPTNIDKMEQNLKRLGRETTFFVADSKLWRITNNNHLPGGVMVIIRGKARALMLEEKTTKSQLGNWIAIHLQHNERIIIIINIYRIPNSTQYGPKCSATQYNLKEGKAKSPSEYRREVLNQIKNYLDGQEYHDVIIAGDFNQNINSNEIKKFFSEIGVEDVHARVNNIQKRTA